MTSVLVNKEDITAYIPHRLPIIMIDTLHQCDRKKSTTSFRIQEGGLFVQNGFLQEPGIIENIAQTAAVMAGYEYRRMGLVPALGFIGAIKNLKIHALPGLNKLLVTTVTIKTEIMGIIVMEGTSECDGIKIVDCEMKILLQKPE